MSNDDKIRFIKKLRIDYRTKQRRFSLFGHMVLTEKCPLHCLQCYSDIRLGGLNWDAFC